MSPRPGLPPGGVLAALLLIFSVALLPACGSSGGSTTLRLTHHVDGSELVFDEVRYTNVAGNEYSVTRLEYYLSKLVLERAGAAPVTLADVHYRNARDAATTERVLEGIPPGEYTGLTVFIGLGPEVNVSGGLPHTVENTNMAWPVPMGGGYHFLKLEGHWRDSATTTAGYAMHLGTNAALVTLHLSQSFTIKAGTTLELRMNVNEWFRTPAPFDFASDPNYTMGNEAAMTKLRDNGADVLTLEVR